jgi:mannose-6-phosphate isomerase-like protein (cupin superfamily)
VLQNEEMSSNPGQTATFDLQAVAASLPDHAETMLIDVRLTDEPAASSRVFRIYRDVPAHFHRTCDEYLHVLSGRARFTVGDAEPMDLGPGQLLFFKRSVVHSIVVLEHPVVVFAVDTPRRDPSDVTFVDPESGSIEAFLRTQEGAS